MYFYHTNWKICLKTRFLEHIYEISQAEVLLSKVDVFLHSKTYEVSFSTLCPVNRAFFVLFETLLLQCFTRKQH